MADSRAVEYVPLVGRDAALFSDRQCDQNAVKGIAGKLLDEMFGNSLAVAINRITLRLSEQTGGRLGADAASSDDALRV